MLEIKFKHPDVAMKTSRFLMFTPYIYWHDFAAGDKKEFSGCGVEIRRELRRIIE